MSELVTDERTEDAGDECKTKDVGINSALPVIEQKGELQCVCVCVIERESERDQTTEEG